MKTGSQVNEKGHPMTGQHRGSRRVRKLHKYLTKKSVRRQAKAATVNENAPSQPRKTLGWCY